MSDRRRDGPPRVRLLDQRDNVLARPIGIGKQRASEVILEGASHVRGLDRPAHEPCPAFDDVLLDAADVSGDNRKTVAVGEKQHARLVAADVADRAYLARFEEEFYVLLPTEPHCLA